MVTNLQFLVQKIAIYAGFVAALLWARIFAPNVTEACGTQVNGSPELQYSVEVLR